MSLTNIAHKLNNSDKNIVLIYAFNSIGKTRLSVAFKDETKNLKDGSHTGVYYNAFSEDLFIWNNNEENIRLTIRQSSLNGYHSLLNEDAVRDKLISYNHKYEFIFKTYKDDHAKGIEYVSFFIKEDEYTLIKISRGEERIFVWCFFLALFEEVEGWADKQNTHFFIDDPVSSLDDHNIFVTAETIFNLIESHYKNRKIIITTHHMGLFSILADWLNKGEKKDRYKKTTELFILSCKTGVLSLEKPDNDVFLYHLHLLQTLDKAYQDGLSPYHFVLLRQVLENIASFLGSGRFSHVLKQIGIEDKELDRSTNIINSLSHKKVYHYETSTMNPDHEKIFKDIFNKLKTKYNFLLHTD